MQLIFMGSPEFAVPALEALISSEHEVVAVYTQPPRPKNRGHQLQPTPIHQLAEKHGIPVYTPNSLKSEQVQQEFAALGADIAVVAAYGLILPQAILDAPKYGCVNIHPSALPRWRGAAPIQRTIMAGDTTTEICIMKMEAGLDTGDIYLRSETITIPEDMNAGELHDILTEQSVPLLLQTLSDIEAGNASATLQPAEGITYADKITKEECRIDWNKSANEIHNHIRGLCPYPGATTLLNGDVLKVLKTTRSPLGGERKVGTALDDQLTIACGGGAIQLLEIQKAGKPRMDAEAFLRGHPVAKGTKLG